MCLYSFAALLLQIINKFYPLHRNQTVTEITQWQHGHQVKYIHGLTATSGVVTIISIDVDGADSDGGGSDGGCGGGCSDGCGGD